MNWSNLFIGLVAVAWLVSVEYRLWLNLRILSDLQERLAKKDAATSAPLRVVEK